MHENEQIIIQGRMDGLLYWQINDLWPGATWASIDAYGRWKAPQYFAKRFYQPLLVGCLENPDDSTMALHVSNHRADAFTGSLRWRATTCSGEVLASGEEAVEVASQSDLDITVVDCADLRKMGGTDLLPLEVRTSKAIPMQGDRNLLFWAFLEEDGEEISHNLGYFAKPKYWKLEDPEIRHQVKGTPDGPVIELVSETCAPWTRLELADTDAVFSDNFLHLVPGRPVQVTVQTQDALSADILADRLRITPLRDCWA